MKITRVMTEDGRIKFPSLAPFFFYKEAVELMHACRGCAQCWAIPAAAPSPETGLDLADVEGRDQPCSHGSEVVFGAPNLESPRQFKYRINARCYRRCKLKLKTGIDWRFPNSEHPLLIGHNLFKQSIFKLKFSRS